MNRGAGTWVLYGIVALVAAGFVLYPVANVFLESWTHFDDRDQAAGVTTAHYAKLFSTKGCKIPEGMSAFLDEAEASMVKSTWA